MSIANKIKSMISDAPEVQPMVNVNFGPLTVTPIIKTFHGGGKKPTVKTLEEFADEQGVAVDDVKLTGQDAFNLRFEINVKDLNENLSFDMWTREVPILASNKSNPDKAKWLLTDWSEIVEPSLVKVFGPNWYDALIGTEKKPAKEFYVACEQADSLRKPKDGAKNYGVPKFITKFANRDECVRARDERYGKKTEEDLDLGTDEEEGIPDEAIAQATSLWMSFKKNDDKTLKMLAKQPFGPYDADALLAAVKAAAEEE